MRRSASLLLALAAACAGPAAPPPSAPPAAPAEARRIVSLAPSFTETLVAIGAADRLVGLCTYCDSTAGAPPDLPRVGGGLDPNLEAVVALRPDLVLSPRTVSSARHVEAIRARGIEVLVLEPRTIADVYGIVGTIGERTGRVEEAAALVERMRAEEAEARRLAERLPRRPRVFIELWRAPIFTAGRGSFLHAAVEAAGGENVFADVEAPTVEVGPEAVAARDPDVVVLLYEGGAAEAGRLGDRPGWRDLRAVREGRVLAGPEIDLLARPGPRITEAIVALARRWDDATR